MYTIGCAHCMVYGGYVNTFSHKHTFFWTFWLRRNPQLKSPPFSRKPLFIWDIQLQCITFIIFNCLYIKTYVLALVLLLHDMTHSYYPFSVFVHQTSYITKKNAYNWLLTVLNTTYLQLLSNHYLWNIHNKSNEILYAFLVLWVMNGTLGSEFGIRG